ncbi:hypothetical protein N7532_008491 [Penicillium argentinense]|uniref:non-specific serine/threonine protein kinase n=1 Tax=Penicillium argentinense TaxID=1131581 RepID=A0A9W9K2K2_9EURO|nr:uncharacterized protein N7532_008491 [Penicillium argentinense]KAJ5089807.1 hypothetical protein N7532_008491 [Penicillium argentinense]
MTVLRERKLRSRRSVFNLWIPSKVVHFSSRFEPSPTDSAVSDSPASDPASSPRGGRRSLKVHLTRSGSKLLFLFGLGGSSSGQKTSAESGSGEDAQSPEGNHTPASDVAERGSPVSTVGDASPESESPDAARSIDVDPTTPDIPPVDPTDSRSQTHAPGKTDTIGGQSDAQGDSNGESWGCCNVDCEPPATSNSNLVDRVSHRISQTFGHPTVIRRVHLRSRPSIPFPESPIQSVPSKQGDGADGSSDPSTSPSSNESPAIGASTLLTPVTSGETSTSSGSKITTTDSSFLGHTSGQSPSSDIRSPILAPSILTVESVSAAKVYLEVYFNSIFQNVDPRVHRQQELEQHMCSFQLSPEAQNATRKNWLMQENEYLRQCRIVKTRMKTNQPRDLVSTAGYETIKILGRGSFGVVRLVREKDRDVPKNTPRNSSESSSDRNLANSRMRSFAMIRSAADGNKNGRRKFMTGEKKEVYAMKVIRKAEMVRNSQEGHIRAERDFLVASEKSRWVVPLIASFQDNTNLYLVMDYMVGGDFLGLLIRKDILREEWTRFYVAEMILCIEEAHRLCWIHRDIKPDNFLISASGHLKISDFGLAFNGHWSHDQRYYHNQRYSLLESLGISIKGDRQDQMQAAAQKDGASEPLLQGLDDFSDYNPPPQDLLNWRDSKERRRFAKSVVGTSQYMAPEVIRGEMYDGRCDWWSLGVILYECFYGFTPFACDNRHDTKLKILQHTRTLQFPREKPSDKLVSQEAIDLISRILQEREYRLCSPRYQANNILVGRPVTPNFLYSMDSQYRNIASYFVFPNDAADIKAHPFFRGIRWNELHLTQPPMIPRVKNWEDTRYFEDWKPSGNGKEHMEDSDYEETDEKSDEKPSEAPEKPCDLFMAQSLPDRLVYGVDAADAVEPAAEPEGQKAPTARRRRERKRPRDKVLRDKKVGKAALEIRKDCAFLGYTYRRPKGPALALIPDRGRRRFDRSLLMDLYAS